MKRIKKWKQTLKEGKEYEIKCATYFCDKYDMIVDHITTGKNPDYDIMFDDSTKFEVKSDSVENSNNMIIEISRYGKLNGINITKSDYWVQIFTLTNELWLFKTIELLKFLRNEYKKCENTVIVINNGRGSRLFLCDRTWLYNNYPYEIQITKNFEKFIK